MTPSKTLGLLAAEAIYTAFDSYHDRFHEITRRARPRFANRDWAGMQADMVERLDIYTDQIGQIVAQVRTILGEQQKDNALWVEMKKAYTRLIGQRDDLELAETFFNSVTRRIFTTVGVNPEIEYVDSDFEQHPETGGGPVYRTYLPGSGTEDLIRSILSDYALQTPFEDMQRDAQLAAVEIDSCIASLAPGLQINAVDIVLPLFFRGKGANLIGRIHAGRALVPLVLALRNDEGGVHLDAVLLREDEVSILFSFTRSYFHVETAQPHRLLEFLKTIMPRKRVAELYISIGYNKHGKTLLYRDLIRHLEQSTDQFEAALGEKGMVMLVFTLPSFDLVFKVIRDVFADPKTTTPQEVKNQYQLVFKHDRAGRLVDAQEFEHLRIGKNRFSPALLEELLRGASNNVTVDGDFVAIRHLYSERRLTPLDIYLREARPETAREAAVDYGYAIKDLAATNIFPGDVLLKNFGVTRHGRVVFYDYDELCLLTECKFRSFASASRYGDEFSSEPSFYVGPRDIFPEEFRTFLGLQDGPREAFLEHHSDLFEASFWRQMQARHRAGEIVDIFPYKQMRRIGAGMQ